MNKRNFLKSIAALGGSALLPSSINPLVMYKTASAAVNYSATNVVAPAIMPQVINIFLYGGPSELSGNLTNIQDINDNSQNPYDVDGTFGSKILVNDVAGDGSLGWITKNGFWRGTGRTPAQGSEHLDDNGAGGRAMQFMLDNKQMSVYRTLFKKLDGTGSHRESLLQSFKGSLDIEGSAGVGTKIAATLFQHRDKFEGFTRLADGTAIDDIVNDPTMILPFVSFEGVTRSYQQDPDFQIPLLFRGITLDENFDNPFSRAAGTNSTMTTENDPVNKIDDLVGIIRTDAYDQRFSKAADSFNLRKILDDKIGSITTQIAADGLPFITNDIGMTTPNLDAESVGLNAGDRLVYPAQTDTRFRYSDRIKAAVTLALLNPSSVYITVGGGLGGWDDHNNGTDDYELRMNDLFEVMKAAMLHIKYFNGTTLNNGGTAVRTTNDNIAINMFGDFGRRVNLNGNQGWDHGNNQNLYTFGGVDLRPPNALGKVVGSTVRVGESGTNDQVTEPAPDSYTAEPMSVAATVFSYFGVQNPEVLTRDDELNPAGVPAIDETQSPEPDLFTPS